MSNKIEKLEDNNFDDFLMFKCNSLKNEFIKCIDEYEKKIFFKGRKMKMCNNKEKEFLNCYLHSNMECSNQLMSLKLLKNEEYKSKSDEVKKKYIEKGSMLNQNEFNGELNRIIDDSMNKNVRLKEFKL